MRAARLGLVLVLGVACGPSRAAYQLDVDRVLRTPARPRELAAPASLAPRPWRVGQWALYAVTGTERAYERLRVVAHDACGWWIEQVRQSPTERVEVEACYRDAPEGVASSLELLQEITIRRDATDPVTLDFRHGANAATKRQLAAVLANLTIDAGALATAPREDVTVPAGTFRQAARTELALAAGGQRDHVTRWIHPAVPLGGTVRVDAATGTVALLDYGP